MWGATVQVVGAALSKQKVAGSIMMLGDYHIVGPRLCPFGNQR